MSSWQSALQELSFDNQCETLGQLHGMENLLRSQQLDVIAELVASERSQYVRDYLCLHIGLTHHEAGVRVRIAEALRSLPLISEAFRDGKMDWARLVLVTQIAEGADDDALYAQTAADQSLNQLKVILARKKAGDADAAERAQDNRFARFRHDDRRQKTTITSEVAIDVGIAMEKSVQKKADSYGLDPATGEYPSQDHAMADALAECILGEAPKAELLIDLEAAALVGEGNADLCGRTIAKETLQRFACDGSARASFIDDKGLPLALPCLSM